MNTTNRIKRHKRIFAAVMIGTLLSSIGLAILSLQLLETPPEPITDNPSVKPYHIWNSTYNEQYSSLSSIGITISHNNSIYTCSTNRTGSYSSGFLIKYDSDGNEIWNKTLRLENTDTYFSKVGIDSNGYIYVVGTFDTSPSELLLAKYNSNGQLIYNITVSDPLDQFWGYDIAIDSNDDIYTSSVNLFNARLVIVKFNTTGHIQYKNQMKFISAARPYSMKVTNDSIYCGGIDNNDLFLSKHNKTNGNNIYSTTYGTTNQDELHDITISLDNNYIYATGFIDNGKDMIIVKYNISDGIQIWNNTYDTGYTYDRSYAIYQLTKNNIIIAGESDAFGHKGTFISYNSTGHQNWIYTFNEGDTTGLTEIHDIIFSKDNYLYTVAHQRNKNINNFRLRLYKFGFYFQPILSNPELIPVSGPITQNFTFKINYKDLNNESPNYVKLYLNDSIYDMNKEDSSDHNYVDGSIYSYNLYLSKGTYEYYYTTSDGTNTTRYPLNQNLTGPIVINTNPDLANPLVIPSTGDIGTKFNFSVIYFDLNNDSPEFIHVHIEDEVYNLVKLNTSDNDYTNGVIYNRTIQIDEAGTYNYYFNAYDGENTTNTTIFSLEVTIPPSPTPTLLDQLWIYITIGVIGVAAVITIYLVDRYWIDIF